MSLNCPDCGYKLEKVRQSPNSSLNDEQFSSIKAGDWFCRNCKGEEGKTGYKYFWDSEVNNQHDFNTVKCIKSFTCHKYDHEITIEPGMIATWFKHGQCYCFNAIDGYVPYFDNDEIFELLGEEVIEPSKGAVLDAARKGDK